MVRDYIALDRAREFDVKITTTKPRGDDFYELLWDTNCGSWRPQDVRGYAPTFMGGINGFISRRFHKSGPVYISVYA
jgi:hypothetical protein